MVSFSAICLLFSFLLFSLFAMYEGAESALYVSVFNPDPDCHHVSLAQNIKEEM